MKKGKTLGFPRPEERKTAIDGRGKSPILSDKQKVRGEGKKKKRKSPAAFGGEDHAS